METLLQFKEKEYQLHRYPATNDKSLKAWSAAELLVLNYLEDKNFGSYHLFNDRFGVWNCILQTEKLHTVWTYASQKKAIEKNILANKLESQNSFLTPLDDFGSVECALIKIPKSLELFELFLSNIHANSNEQTEVVCGFMTKYFSASFLKIVEKYFEDVSQSKAWKKARLLILKSPKPSILKNEELINEILWRDRVLKQYYGVFSSKSIDIGTQFLLSHLEVNSNELNVLDVASGNGIIASEVLELNTEAKVTVVDDFNLAVDSSKMNLPTERANFVCDNNLKSLPKENYDLVLSNPPFHFEYENNIEVSLDLFSQIKDCLKNKGRFVLVANKHLNYKVHLKKLFTEVTIIHSNKKFEIISCLK
ncbi:methyltransferase [uncultured Tenacibaculum sp.]|uniref:methyltransferase n=1 Tax=uncultured Tenacibaculum sp. TaxID=174713 RepID=UPI00262E4605|nr:methyltransferase [uncultured Tenacibaculum sp.]